MSNSAPDMGQGEGTLTRAASMVADAKADFDGFSRRLEGQVAGLQGRWTGAGASAFFAPYCVDRLVPGPQARMGRDNFANAVTCFFTELSDGIERWPGA